VFEWCSSTTGSTCGSPYTTFDVPSFDKNPFLLKMVNGEDDAYYTVVLVNPSNTVESIGPVVHLMVANLKGSDI
jgi:hypothetical protein